MLGAMTALLRKLHDLVMEEVQQVSGVKGRLLDAARLGYHVARKAWEDHFAQRAAALSFFTLVNLFPVLVLFLFFLSRSPLFKDYMVNVQGLLLRQLVASGARQVVDDLFRNLSANLDVLGSGVSGFLGLLVLIALGTSLLMLVERYFNDIWRAPRSQRNLLTRMAMLWTGLTLFPLLIAFSFALSARLGKGYVPGFFTHYALPYLLTLALFFTLYKAVPSVPVSARSALTASVMAALLWEAAKLALGAYVKGVFAKSVIGKLYGSVALVPIAMAWIYYSWLIVLFGAELAYTLDHLRELHDEARKRWLLNQGYTPLSCAAALAVAAEAARGFLVEGKRPASPAQLAGQHGLHPDQVQLWAGFLVEAGFFERTGEGGLLPAKSPALVPAPELAALYAARFQEAMAGFSPCARLLADLERARAAATYDGMTLEDLARGLPPGALQKGRTP